jgi:hypothetical protein
MRCEGVLGMWLALNKVPLAIEPRSAANLSQVTGWTSAPGNIPIPGRPKRNRTARSLMVDRAAVPRQSQPTFRQSRAASTVLPSFVWTLESRPIRTSGNCKSTSPRVATALLPEESAWRSCVTSYPCRPSPCYCVRYVRKVGRFPKAAASSTTRKD